MNLNCDHIESQNTACKTCNKLICTDCAVNVHYDHDVIAFNQIILNYKKSVNKNKTNCITLIDKNSSDILKLLEAKKDLNENTYRVSGLYYECNLHSLESVSICTECNKWLCIVCCTTGVQHCQHKPKMLFSLLSMDTLSKIEEKISKRNNDIEKFKLELNNLNINLSDEQIIKNFFSDIDTKTIEYKQSDTPVVDVNTDTPIEDVKNDTEDNQKITIPISYSSDNVFNNNKVYDLDFVNTKKIKYGSNYELITEDCVKTLIPGYYMIIAVGGGGSGIVGCAGGAGSGYVTAKIVDITDPTVINVTVGKCGSCTKIIFNQFEIINNENPTGTLFNDFEIDADCGESNGILTRSNSNDKTLLVCEIYHGTLCTNSHHYTYQCPICRQSGKPDGKYYVTEPTGRINLRGGKGFSGGGDAGNMGGTNGSNARRINVIKHRRIDLPDSGYIQISVSCGAEKELNGSESSLIDDIQKIFPLVYPGYTGCSKKNNDLGVKFTIGSENKNILIPSGCGGGGLGLTGFNNYTSNGQLVNHPLASEGFGAGGNGCSYYYSETTKKIEKTECTKGTDGCVIIVKLVPQ